MNAYHSYNSGLVEIVDRYRIHICGHFPLERICLHIPRFEYDSYLKLDKNKHIQTFKLPKRKKANPYIGSK